MAAPAPEPTWFCGRGDGSRHGPFITLFPDGTVQIAGRYKDGKLDGAWQRSAKICKGMRKEAGEPRIMENFELLASRVT